MMCCIGCLAWWRSVGFLRIRFVQQQITTQTHKHTHTHHTHAISYKNCIISFLYAQETDWALNTAAEFDAFRDGLANLRANIGWDSLLV
jgi:hypothetical protein